MEGAAREGVHWAKRQSQETALLEAVGINVSPAYLRCLRRNAQGTPVKKFERQLLRLLLTLAGVGLLAACGSLMPAYPDSWPTSSRLFGTAGLLAALSGFVQLDVTDFFGQIISHYSDDEKYPGGPPSHITRQIIDNPDRPLGTFIRNSLYFRPRTGFLLVCLGTLLQIASLWV